MVADFDEPWWVSVRSKPCHKDCQIIGCDNPECGNTINYALLNSAPCISEIAVLRIIELIRQKIIYRLIPKSIVKH